MRPKMMFKLAQDGAHPFCDEGGATLGDSVALLEKDASGHWSPRPQAQLESLLSLGYGGPVELSSRMGWLRQVAKYLNDGKVGQAGIALLHAQLPPLPSREAARRMAKADRLGKFDLWHILAGHGRQSGEFTHAPKGDESQALHPQRHVRNARRTATHRPPGRNVHHGPKPLTYQTMAAAIAQGNRFPDKIPNTVLLALSYKESSFIPQATASTTTAHGLFQITEKSRKDYIPDVTREDLEDPVKAARAASTVLNDKIKEAHGDLRGGLMRYLGAKDRSEREAYADSILAAAAALRDHPEDPIGVIAPILHPHRQRKTN